MVVVALCTEEEAPVAIVVRALAEAEALSETVPTIFSLQVVVAAVRMQGLLIKVEREVALME
jgi:hypothetical protein